MATWLVEQSRGRSQPVGSLPALRADLQNVGRPKNPEVRAPTPGNLLSRSSGLADSRGVLGPAAGRRQRSNARRASLGPRALVEPGHHPVHIDAEPLLPYALGIGFTGGLGSRQAGVLDPLPRARLPLQGNESLSPSGPPGGQLVAGRSERLGNQLQPAQHAAGREDRGGVRPRRPAHLEAPEGTAALQEFVQPEDFCTAGEHAVAQLAAYRPIATGRVSLQAAQELPSNTGADRFRRVAVSQRRTALQETARPAGPVLDLTLPGRRRIAGTPVGGKAARATCAVASGTD